MFIFILPISPQHSTAHVFCNILRVLLIVELKAGTDKNKQKQIDRAIK